MAESGLLTRKREEVLVRKRPDLIRDLKLSPDFWASLVKHNVLLGTDAYLIKSRGQPSGMIYDLVEHLLKGTNRSYQGFLLALSETDQECVVTQILEEKALESLPEPEIKTTVDQKEPSWKQLLQRKTTALKKYIKIDDRFWSALIHNHVLSPLEVEAFKEDGKASAARQIQDLLEYLSQGTKQTYRGFLYTLSETGQRHIVTDILEVDVPDLQKLETQDKKDSLLTVERRKLLKATGPDLIKSIKPKAELWDSLLKHRVLTEVEKKLITTGKKASSQEISELLDYIKTNQHYEGFICSLIETNQKDVVTSILREDLTHYTDQYIQRGQLVANRFQRKAIMNMKADYKRRFQVAIPEFSIEQRRIRPDSLYTSLDIIEKTGDKKNQRITEDGILNINAEGQVQTLCLGEAGCGKTTLANRLAWLWATDQHNTHFWKTINAVLLITSLDEGTNLNETMKNAVPGKLEYKDLIMDLWRDEPESVLVIVEAFDQFQNPEVIREINQMVKDHATNIFLTVRKNNSRLTSNFTSLFNQRLEINGFTTKQGKTFAEKMLKEMNSQYETQKFLKAIHEKPKIETNPLNLMLACQLYSEGELEDQDLAALTEVSLYSMRENRMVEREWLRKKSHDVKAYEDEVRKIQNLAMYILFTKAVKCTKGDLETFNIKPNSPGLVLLAKQKRFTARSGHEEFWVWPHSRLQEFDAAVMIAEMTNIRGSQWLYWIADKPDLNPVAQLSAAILGMAGKQTQVKDLTMATILLQSRVPCTADTHSADMDLHPCSWMANVRASIQTQMTLKRCFSNGEWKHPPAVMEPPDLPDVSKCCGSLFNGNVSLFQHVQECWKVGHLDRTHKEFIVSSQATLLPAVDRSEEDCVHVMLCQVNEWKQVVNASESHKVTELEMHFGLYTERSVEVADHHLSWKLCLKEIFEDVHPIILRVHHNGNRDELTEDIIRLVNNRQFMIQSKDNAWYMWASGENIKTSQRSIPGTSRSAFLSNTKPYEFTAEVHCIQDVIFIPDDMEFGISAIVVNVGFPTTTFYHGPQPQESSREWQEGILHILNTWEPDGNLVIRSSDPEACKGALSEEFMGELRNSVGFDVIHEQGKEFQFIKMIDVQTHGKGRDPVTIYRTGADYTVVKVAHPSDALTIEFDSNHLGEHVHLVMNDVESSWMPDELEDCIKHLLRKYNLKSLVIKNMHSKTYLCEVINKQFMDRMNKEGYSLHDRNGQIFIKWNKEDLREIKVPNSNRCVLIKDNVDHKAEIYSTEPGDILGLKRSDIHQSTISELIVRFGHNSTPSSDLPSMKSLHNDIEHLLSTFTPDMMSIYFLWDETRIKDHFQLGTECGQAYHGFFTLVHDVDDTEVGCLALIRQFWREDLYQVLQNTRCQSLVLSQLQENEAEILLTDPQDCVNLTEIDLSLDRVEQLSIVFGLNSMAKANLLQSPRYITEVETAIHHILHTYKPKVLNVHTDLVKGQVPMTKNHFFIDVHHDKTYSVTAEVEKDESEGQGNSCNIQLTEKPFKQLNIRDSEGSISFKEDPAEDINVTIVSTNLEDCLFLQRNHIQSCDIRTMLVQFGSSTAEVFPGPASEVSKEVLAKAIRHLLLTFHPKSLALKCKQSEVKDKCYQLWRLQDGRIYMKNDDVDDEFVEEVCGTEEADPSVDSTDSEYDGYAISSSEDSSDNVNDYLSGVERCSSDSENEMDWSDDDTDDDSDSKDEGHGDDSDSKDEGHGDDSDSKDEGHGDDSDSKDEGHENLELKANLKNLIQFFGRKKNLSNGENEDDNEDEDHSGEGGDSADGDDTDDENENSTTEESDFERQDSPRSSLTATLKNLIQFFGRKENLSNGENEEDNEDEDHSGEGGDSADGDDTDDEDENSTTEDSDFERQDSPRSSLTGKIDDFQKRLDEYLDSRETFWKGKAAQKHIMSIIQPLVEQASSVMERPLQIVRKDREDYFAGTTPIENETKPYDGEGDGNDKEDGDQEDKIRMDKLLDNVEKIVTIELIEKEGKHIDVPHSKRCILIEDEWNPEINISMTMSQDALVLRRDHVQQSEITTMRVNFGMTMEEEVCCPAFKETSEAVEAGLCHLLEVFNPDELIVSFKSDIKIRDWQFTCMAEGNQPKTYHSTIQRGSTDSKIVKFQASIRRLEVPGSSRCILVKEDSNKKADIILAHLDDYEILKRHHIHEDVEEISVEVLSNTLTLNNALEESTSDWRPLLHHLLDTYRPCILQARLSRQETTNRYRFCMSIHEDQLYYGRLNKDEDTLVFERDTESSDERNIVKISNSNRCILISEGTDEKCQAAVWATRFEDCLELQKRHLRQDRLDTLTLCLIPGTCDKVDVLNEEAEVSIEQLHRAICHVLSVFQPQTLRLRCNWTGKALKRKFYVCLQNGKTYLATQAHGTDLDLELDTSHNYEIERCERKFEKVASSNSSRFVLIDKTSNRQVIQILLDEPEDCRELQKRHIKESEKRSAYVRFWDSGIQATESSCSEEQFKACYAAIRHILQTYRPRQLQMSLKLICKSLNKVFTIALENGSVYEASQKEDQRRGLTTFTFTCKDCKRCHGNFTSVKVANTSRTIFVKECPHRPTRILFDEPGDYPYLQENHSFLGVWKKTLIVEFGTKVMYSVEASPPEEYFQECYMAIRHVLTVCRPRKLSAIITRAIPHIECSFRVSLADGTMFKASNESDSDDSEDGHNISSLQFSRRRSYHKKNFRRVAEQRLNSNIMVKEREDEVYIMIEHLDDCHQLQREDFQYGDTDCLHITLHSDAVLGTHVLEKTPETVESALRDLLLTFDPLLVFFEMNLTKAIFKRPFYLNLGEKTYMAEPVIHKDELLSMIITRMNSTGDDGGKTLSADAKDRLRLIEKN